MDAILPCRGINLSMNRLRMAGIPIDEVNDTVKRLLLRSVEIVEHVGLNPVVLTADRLVGEILPSVELVFDEGKSLNNAISVLLEQKKSNLNDEAIFLMTDLPYLIEMELLALKEMQIDIVVAPSKDNGISAIKSPMRFLSNIEFGPKSFDKFVGFARNSQLSYRTVISDGFLFDLDTIEDYRKWKGEIKQFR